MNEHLTEPILTAGEDTKRAFKAAKRAADKARKSDGKTVVTCPASRHTQMIAEYVGTGKGYTMLQDEPEHCAESILSTVTSLYEARLLLAKNLTLTALEVEALHEAADFMTSEGDMPALRADLIAARLRALALQGSQQ